MATRKIGCRPLLKMAFEGCERFPMGFAKGFGLPVIFEGFVAFVLLDGCMDDERPDSHNDSTDDGCGDAGSGGFAGVSRDEDDCHADGSEEREQECEQDGAHTVDMGIYALFQSVLMFALNRSPSCDLAGWSLIT